MKYRPGNNIMPLIPQAQSSYNITDTCQIENLGKLFEALPKPFGVFDPNYRGRFVEVGAFDGKTYSNIWQFAESQWPGIMIEPMPANLELLRKEHKDRPWVIVEPVACDDHEGLLPMFFEREGSREAKAGELTFQIPCMRLDDILTKHNWEPDWDILVIDVETHEQPVLRGFDLAKWRPKVAIVEAYDWQREWIIKRFEGYRVYYADGLNVIFTRTDWAP